MRLALVLAALFLTGCVATPRDRTLPHRAYLDERGGLGLAGAIDGWGGATG